jgi:hypothetical protein
MGKSALNDRSIVGIEKQAMKDGATRYSTKESAKVERAAERPYQPDTKEAWEALKTAAKGLGSAVLIKTATKATEVVNGLAEMVKPAPKTIRVDASRVQNLVDACKPTPYLVAHTKALLAGAFQAAGNPHERAGHAEKVYAKLRSHQRLPKNSVIVVSNALSMTANERNQLAKIARRDKAHVILTDFKPQSRNQNLHQHHGRSQGRTP